MPATIRSRVDRPAVPAQAELPTQRNALAREVPGDVEGDTQAGLIRVNLELALEPGIEHVECHGRFSLLSPNKLASLIEEASTVFN